MSIAIQRKNGDLIWFDAVVSYSRQYTSSVTKHPVESGGTITDNVSQDNPVFTISGVISNADFNTTRPFINSADASTYKLSDRRIYNSQPIPLGAQPVIGSNVSPMMKYLPQSLNQFAGVRPPSVEVPDSQRPDWVYEVEEILTEMERSHELVTILDFSHIGFINKNIDDCYISSLSFSETTDTGDSFDVNMTIEKVQFVTLKEETLSDDVDKSINGKTASKQNKGNVTPESVPATSQNTVGVLAPDPKSAKETPTHFSSGLKEIGNNVIDVSKKALGI
jgi:hypothetical protein